MKTSLFKGTAYSVLLSCVLLLVGAWPRFAMGQSDRTLITSIRPQGSNVVVVVHVPAGIQRVTLESRSRLDGGAWVPAAVTQTDGLGGTVTFQLAATQKTELLRVRADSQPPLPTAFYTGARSFDGPTSSAAAPPGLLNPGDVNGVGTALTPGGGDARAVVESDIWKLNGDTLYFFNQYRGLQVLDISNPDAAVIRGTLELPAAGEQMYLADSNHVVLLAANGCAYYGDGSQVILVGVSNGTPKVVTNLPLVGSIQESRMVGTALYVASQTYRPVVGDPKGSWEWGTLVSGFDLANPEQPISQNTLWFPGYGNVVAATDTYLFVVTQDSANWWQSIVRVIDITSPDGTMASYGSIRTAGRVQDKYKLNYTD